MQKYCQKSFNKFDIFGSEVGLIYKKDSLYRTAFGGFVTIVFVVSLILIFFHNVTYTNNLILQKIQVLSKSNQQRYYSIFISLMPQNNHINYSQFLNFFNFNFKDQVSFVSSTSYDVNPEVIDIEKNKFMFAVKVDQANFIQRPTFMIGFERRHYYTMDNGTYVQKKEPVYLEPCTIEHFNSLPNFKVNWTEQFIEQKIDDYLCLMKNETFPIGGRFQSPDFFHLKFTVTKCSNKTNPLNPWKYQCASKEVIDQKLKDEDNRIQFLFSNYLLKPEQPSETTQVFLDALIFTIQPDKMYTTANVFINEQTLVTDESILPFKDVNEFSLPIYNYGDFRQQYSAGNFTKFCEIFIQRSAFSTSITRQFQKIDEMISYIGGFSQIFLLVSTFIKLANRLYEFDPKITKQQRQNQNPLRYINKPISQNQMDKIGSFQIKNDVDSPKVDQSIQSAKRDDEDFTKQVDRFNLDGMSSSRQVMNKVEEQTTRRKQLSIDLKKIKNREDAGLMPLEDIRKIISSRKKTYIKQTKYLMRNKQKNNINEQKTNLSPIKQSNDNEEVEQSPILLNEINFQVGPLSPTSVVSDNYLQSIDKINFIQSLNQLNDNDQKQPISNVIQEQNSPSNYKLNNGQENSDVSRQNISPLIKFQKRMSLFKQDKFSQKADNNIILPTRSGSKFGTLVSPDPLNQKDIESNNSLFKGYEKNVFEGLGFNDANSFLEKELEFILKRDRSLKITYHYFINIMTCGKFCNTNEVKLLSKASELVRKDLDIFNVLDKIKEVDKLKKILFTQEEQILFNFFPKPVIFINDQQELPSRQQMEETERKQGQISSKIKLNNTSKKFNINLNNIAIISKAMNAFKKNLQKNRITEYQTLFNSYDKITSKSHTSIVKQKLIDLLGDEMKNIFEVTKLMQLKKNELQCGESGIYTGRLSNHQRSFEGNLQLNLQLNKNNSLGASFEKFNKSFQQHKVSQFKQPSTNKIEEILSNPKLDNIANNDQDLNMNSKDDSNTDDNSSRKDSQEQHQLDNEENMGNTNEISSALARNIEKIKLPYTKQN